MTYQNEILATVRRLLVSLLSLVRPSFKSIRSVLKSERSCEPFRCVLRPELPGMEQPFAGMLGWGCKAEASAGRRMRGMWRRRVRRRKRRGTKARKEEREREREGERAAMHCSDREATPPERRGGRQQPSVSVSRSLAHARARAVLC